MSLEIFEPPNPSLPPFVDLRAPAPADLKARALLAVERGTTFLFSTQFEDFHWCAELESNPTITAEYVLMRQMLGLDQSHKRDEIRRYLLGKQNMDGGWGIAEQWRSDVSTSAEVYLALRLLGVSQEGDALKRAERFLLENGGIEKVRVFTRIFFAMFGLMPWEAVPAIPPEFIFLPPESPMNIYSLSSWARGTMIPLFILFHHKPLFALPNGKRASNPWLDHLWRNRAQKNIPYCPPLPSLVFKNGMSWKSFFGFGDLFVRLYDRFRVSAIREEALRRCTDWILERQEESGDWAGIFPPMLNSVIALVLRGYGVESEPVEKGLRAIEKFAWEDADGFRIQACVSPVWDTVLSAIALVDSNCDPSQPRLAGAMKWVSERQLLVDYGDWKIYRPDLEAGGWSFEYSNSWYPDVDDTAAVCLALMKQDPTSARGDTVVKALRWMIGMQNKDGGWAAFDVDNDKLFLNEIPFSDMDSLCDPSSPDVAGRVVEAFGLWLEIVGKTESALADLRSQVERSLRVGVGYLRHTQEEQGSWYGRWGVNYIYGTSNALCGLARARVSASSQFIALALQWLKDKQNPDGGWGESVASYDDKSQMGIGPSSPSQTAWALMGLLSYLPAEDPAVERGIDWLTSQQQPASPHVAFEGGLAVPIAEGWSWSESAFTGTGFPNHFYLRYHLYRHYFPMMALGRYLAKSGR